MFKFLFFVLSFLSLQAASCDLSLFDYCFYRPGDNLVYINFPKCGSTYMVYALASDLTRPLIATLPKEDLDNAITLIVARDPATRVISSYLEVLKCREDGQRLMKDMPFYLNRKNVEESFYQYLLELKNGYFDPHVYPQHAILERAGILLEDVSFIIDLKTLKSDLSLFTKKHHFQIYQHNRLPQYRGDLKIKARVKRYIEQNRGIRKLIKEIYAEDFAFYEQCMIRRKEIFQSLLASARKSSPVD